MRPLGVIPMYVTDRQSYDLTARAVQTFAASASDDADLIVVDDCSPDEEHASKVELGCNRLGAEYVRRDENGGFAKTVNVGLDMALHEGRDAVLVNADVEFVERDWLRHMRDTDAYVVGAQLLYPLGLIQHAGIYFSVLHRDFDHIYRFAPHNLPEAQRMRRCPVTGALQYIRNEALALVGLYDEGFEMGFEDVDYCIRVFDAGRDCQYQPLSRAIHRESMFRDTEELREPSRRSKMRLFKKHQGKAFADYMPTMLEG